MSPLGGCEVIDLKQPSILSPDPLPLLLLKQKGESHMTSVLPRALWRIKRLGHCSERSKVLCKEKSSSIFISLHFPLLEGMPWKQVNEQPWPEG